MVKTGAGGMSKVDLSKIAEDIIPEVHNTYDLGSESKQWAYLWVAIAMVTSLTIGGAIGLSNIDSILFINASTMINGSLIVLGDNITIGGIEVATLNDLTAGNVTVSSLVKVKNTAGATANKGAAMTFESYNAAIDRYDVIFANNSVREGHAHCLMTSTVVNNGQGQCLVFGALETFDTSGWSEGEDIYLNETPGTLTDIKPLSSECIQKLGVVLRSHAVQGSVYVHGAGRCNDVPYNFSVLGNITANYFFGDGSQLTNIAGSNLSWNQTLADTLYANIALTNVAWINQTNTFTKNQTLSDELILSQDKSIYFGAGNQYYNGTCMIIKGVSATMEIC